MRDLMYALLHRDEGATMVEYGLMVALIAIVALLAVTALGGSVRDVFTSISGALIPFLMVRDGKGGKDRWGPLDEEATRALRRQMQRPDGTLRVEGWVFPAPYDDGPLSQRPVQKMVAKLAAAAGIPGKVTPHALRHTFAVECLRRGFSLEWLRRVLGHSDLSTTQIYLELDDEFMRGELAKHRLPFSGGA